MSASEDRVYVDMPPISDYAEWLVGIARRIGLGEGGDVVTGYVDINAWCEAGVRLTLWERETVRAMSQAYIQTTRRLRDNADVPPPWMDPEARARLERQIEQFESFKANRGG